MCTSFSTALIFMPVLSYMRWVRKHFLADPIVQSLEPKVRIKGGCLIVTSPRFKAGLSLVFTHDSLQVCLHENGELIDVVEWLDMAPVRVGKHQFECTFCVVVENHERFSSVRRMYLDHCIQPMLAHLCNGKYLRLLGDVV
jgi:hypothetical protein